MIKERKKILINYIRNHFAVIYFTLLFISNLKYFFSRQGWFLLIYNIWNFLTFIYCTLLNKQIFYVIGDSHTFIFMRKKHFIVYHLGPTTAYNLKNKSSTTNSNENLWKKINKINKKHILILVFGEIDCRIHIYYQYRKNNRKIKLIKLIDNTINSYGQLLEKLKFIDLNFYVLGIPPASKQDNIYDYKFYAPPRMRSLISREFNMRLKQYCLNNNYKYIDVYQKTSDKNGFILNNYAKDEVHLNAKVLTYILEVIKKN